MANIIEVDRINNIVILGTTGTTTRFPFCAANRMIYLNSESDVTSISDLTNWIAGTENQITVTDDGDGTVTLSTDLGGIYQPLDAGLTSLAGLTYASDSFIKVTATDTYAIRTIAETKTDLSLNLVENTALSTWAGTSNIVTVGTLTAGAIGAGFTEIGTAYTAAKCTDATADNTAGNETSHADVLVDGEFASAGLMYTDGAATYSIKAIGTDVQAYHANLASTAGLTYAAAAFVKMTGANTFALRTIGETADDLEATIDHDNLANYDANKHIDHIGVTLTAGVGLTGGGDISANRTFDLSVNELSELDPPTLSQVYIPIYNTGTSTHYKVLGTKFGMLVDRGDAAGDDWDETTLTTDETWNDLDCSSVVPANAKAILFEVVIEDNTVDAQFILRENGNSNTINIDGAITQVANVRVINNIIVACDSNRIVEYYGSAIAWTRIDLTIRGWWF